jgi:hypothetical protein
LLVWWRSNLVRNETRCGHHTFATIAKVLVKGVAPSAPLVFGFKVISEVITDDTKVRTGSSSRASSAHDVEPSAI